MDKEAVLDEDDNVYVLFLAEEEIGNNESCIISFGKDGSARWKKEFSGSFSSDLLYQNSRLIFATSNSGNNNPISEIFFVNPINGEIIVSHSYYSSLENYDPPKIAVLNEKCYMLSDIDSMSKITAYSIEGIELWNQDIDFEGESIYADENCLYLKSFSAIQKYLVHSTDCEFVWEWQHPDAYYISTLKFGSDGNVFCENAGNIYHVLDGQLMNILFADLYVSKFYINQENDLFVIASGLTKVDLNGNTIWTSSLNCETSSLTIAPDGTIYSGSMFGIYTVNSEGEFMWKSPDPTDYLSVRSPLINSDGNLILLASGKSPYIYCMKGN